MPVSASRAVEIPDSVPPGPLRTWMERRKRAGTPSLSAIAELATARGQKVSTATVRRMLLGETCSAGPATAVAYTLAELDSRPVSGNPSDDWDSFDEQLRRPLEAAHGDFNQPPSFLEQAKPLPYCPDRRGQGMRLHRHTFMHVEGPLARGEAHQSAARAAAAAAPGGSTTHLTRSTATSPHRTNAQLPPSIRPSGPIHLIVLAVVSQQRELPVASPAS